jgi:hypothetical protein
MKKIRKLVKFLIIVIMPIILLGVAIKLLFFNYSVKELMNTQKTESVQNNMWDDSVPQVKDYLKDSFDNMDSYESLEWSKVKKISGVNYNYIVRHKFKIKNGYGGTELYNKNFYLNEKGVVVDVQDYRGTD